MTESLEKIIGRGFHSWTRNLNICIPLIINYLIQLIIFFLAIVVLMFILFKGRSPDEIISFSEEEILTYMSLFIMENIPAVIILTISVLIVLMLFDAYFLAGAVGMSQNAISRGDTNMGDMFNSASKNFMNVFLASFLMALLKIAGIIFVVPGAVLTRNYLELIESSQFTGGILLLLAGIIVWMIYILVLTVVFAAVIYALVIEQIGALDGIFTGYRFFMENKINVFLLWLFILVISTIVGLIFYFISYVISLLGNEALNMTWSFGNQLIILLTLQPLIIIWWTRLYMVKTGKSIHTHELLTEPWG